MRRLKRVSLTTRLAWTGFLFVLPFTLGFLFFFLKPLIQSVSFMFSKVDIGLDGYQLTFTGWDNLRYVFREDATFVTNLVTSLENLLWQAPVILVFSLFFAIVLNQKFRGRVVARAIFFLPVIIASGVIMNIIQSDTAAGSVLSGDVVAAGTVIQSDGLREILSNSGLNSTLIDTISAMADNLFNLTWKTGIQMIVFLAGLQSIPSSLYEASAIEGATAWESFWKITLPMLAPILQLNLVYTIVDSFTDANNLVMTQVMNNARLVRYGWTSAMSWSYFLLIGIILAVVFLAFFKLDRPSKKSYR